MPEKETIEDQFTRYTGRAGEISRQLGLAGVAAIWAVFTVLGRSSDNSRPLALPGGLKLALGLIVLSLAIDLCQYIIGSWVYYRKWRKGHDEDKLKQHPKFVAVLVFMVLLKLTVMVGAYSVLGKAVWSLIGK